MIFFCMIVFAQEISFYLHNDVQREEWLNTQKHSLQMEPIVPDWLSSSLQKRGASHIVLRNMLRWSGGPADYLFLEQTLRSDPAVQWVFVERDLEPAVAEVVMAGATKGRVERTASIRRSSFLPRSVSQPVRRCPV